MTDGPKRRYLRVYHLDLQTEYPEVWFDPTAPTTWLRLLSLTDLAWPAPATLPRAVRRADLTLLTNVGLVTLIDRDRFTMKGYAKERTHRADKARESVSHRYERSTNVERPYIERTTNDVLRDAGGAASVSVVESLSEKTGNAGATTGYPTSEDLDCLDTYNQLTRFRPWGIWSGDKLKGAAREYGDQNVTDALRAESDVDPDVDTLMDRAFTRLAKAADRAKAAKPKRPQSVRPKVDEKARNALIVEMMKPKEATA